MEREKSTQNAETGRLFNTDLFNDDVRLTTLVSIFKILKISSQNYGKFAVEYDWKSKIARNVKK